MEKLEKKLKAKECNDQNSLEFQVSYFEDFFMGQHKNKFILDQKSDISESADLFYGIDSSKKFQS